jgi:predicted transcriptional regulator
MTNGRYILAALRVRPGTCDELEQRTELAHQVVSARLKNLADAKLIKKTGKRRPTRLGRMAAEWRAA